MARLRNAASTQTTKSATSATCATRGNGRPALKEKTNTTRPSTAPVYEDDGNTEDLVKDAKPKRGRPRKSQQSSDELLMTSGLGLKDDALEKENSDMPTADELAKSDNVAPPVVKPNRRPGRPARKVLHNEKQSAVLDGLKRRMEATARDQRVKQTAMVMTETTTTTLPTKGPAHSGEEDDDIAVAQKSSQISSDKLNEPTTERSGFSLSPSPPPPGKLSTARRPSVAPPGSALRMQKTPAVEASIMALKNFKRRPRQPSMLQMVQQRTASARHSLANTVAVETAVEDSSMFDLDGSDEEDEFAPEAEGTPLKVTKKRQSTATTKRKSKALDADEEYNVESGSKKRRTSEADFSSLSTSSTRSRRRMPSHDGVESQISSVPAEQIALPQSSQRDATPPLAQSSEIQVVNSPSTSTPPTEPSSLHYHSTSKDNDFAVPSTEREEMLVRSSPRPELEDAEDEDIPNGTMAEPLSSSPATRAAVVDSFAAVSSPTPPVKSPPKRKTKPLTTSMLQSLLPKKRAPLKPRRRKSEYDLESDSGDDGSQIDVSHLQDDEDELGGELRRKKATPLKGIRRGRRATKKPATAARKASAAAAAMKTTRTYGRATTSDEESEDYDSAEEEESVLPEVSISLGDASLSKELEDAKKKFAEVDDFDMEFESMSQEHHRSSSQGWR